MAQPGKAMLDARKRLIQAEGQLEYILTRFGDKLGERDFQGEVNGIEAVWLFLIRTHHWTPAVVRSMTPEDIRFALTMEMRNFTVDEPTE